MSRPIRKGLEPSAPACLQYTGGTTGVSKGAILTHRNLIMNVAQFLCFTGSDINEGDHVLTALPLYHCFAFTVNFLGFFFRGAHNVAIANPRPLSNLRRVFEKEEITFITGVNTLFNGLLHESLVLREAAARPPPFGRRRHGLAGRGRGALARGHGHACRRGLWPDRMLPRS